MSQAVARPTPHREIVHDLFSLAGELQVHVLLPFQINREPEPKAALRHLSSFHEIGRSAHNVLVLNRSPVDACDVLDGPGRVSSARSSAIDVTHRRRHTGARVPIALDNRTARFPDVRPPVDARWK